MIEGTSLSKSFSANKALDTMDLHVGAGEVDALQRATAPARPPALAGRRGTHNAQDRAVWLAQGAHNPHNATHFGQVAVHAGWECGGPGTGG